MSDLNSGGLSSGEETTSRRLPLHGGPRAGTDPFSPGTGEENPFAGSTLGAASTPSGGLFDPGPTLPGAPTDDDAEEAQRRARTSFPAVLGLLAAVIGGCAVFTGQLVVAALALGCAGIVLSVLALFTAHRRHVGGRLVAVLAILVGLATVGLAFGEHQHLDALSWLNAEIPGRVHDWLHAHLPLLS